MKHFVIAIELKDDAYQTLVRYSNIADKPAVEIAATLLETALLHFMAGELSGMDRAKAIYNPEPATH